MSQTIAMDAVGPSRWAHMASVMSDVLQAAVERGATEASQTPVAVLSAAEQFFKLAADVLEGHTPENPQASVANYRIAANAIRASMSPPPSSRQGVEERIRLYEQFVSALHETRTLSQHELETARALRDFFKELASEGAAERYEKFASMTVRSKLST